MQVVPVDALLEQDDAVHVQQTVVRATLLYCYVRIVELRGQAASFRVVQEGPPIPNLNGISHLHAH